MHSAQIKASQYHLRLQILLEVNEVDMDIKQLHYFVEVSPIGSFTQAAEMLHFISGMSMFISRLKMSLALAVFKPERVCSLTEDGEFLLKKAGGNCTYIQ